MMPVTKQCCSLELAQRLKELGVPQETLHYWIWGHTTPIPFIDTIEPWSPPFESCSAYTVGELGEIIGEACHSWNCNSQWHCSKDVPLGRVTSDETEADARAKMLIYLLEKGLLKL